MILRRTRCATTSPVSINKPMDPIIQHPYNGEEHYHHDAIKKAITAATTVAGSAYLALAAGAKEADSIAAVADVAAALEASAASAAKAAREALVETSPDAEDLLAAYAAITTAALCAENAALAAKAAFSSCGTPVAIYAMATAFAAQDATKAAYLAFSPLQMIAEAQAAVAENALSALITTPYLCKYCGEKHGSEWCPEKPNCDCGCDCDCDCDCDCAGYGCDYGS